ncbi:hypothetical protein FH972_022765 [Carpinus fangiana]|uniref:Uncharacterized protein n=1 Tax=Carpinus fangiana TaxID=176857 RepID=A0A5N6KTP6_9ROSI|nr:hypothetical protein FH972_022765 [Carpinus fangiana]
MACRALSLARWTSFAQRQPLLRSEKCNSLKTSVDESQKAGNYKAVARCSQSG